MARKKSDEQPDIVDQYGDWAFMRELLAFFGVRRTVEVFGYAVVMGLTCRPDDENSVIVDRLVKWGFSRAGVYRTLADIKRFRHYLEEKNGLTIPLSEIIEQFSPENLSRIRDSVVH